MLLILGCLPAAPQSGLRSVAGIVTDRRGIALPDAVVQLENTASLSVVSYITGKDGRYHFTGLRDDIDYTLQAKRVNLWSKPRTLSQLDSSKRCEFNLVIPTE